MKNIQKPLVGKHARPLLCSAPLMGGNTNLNKLGFWTCDELQNVRKHFLH